MIHRELEKRHPIPELIAELRGIASPDLGLVVLDLLYQIAHSDFEFDAEEEAVLVQIANVWGFDEADVSLIRARYSINKSTSSTNDIDAYQTLGLSPNASPYEIKDAYRRLVKQFHPDVVAHLGEEFKLLAEQKMKTISEAYQHVSKR